MANESNSNTRRPSYNLRHHLTSFVGRDVELAELQRLLDERRLVTLIGAGGSGKTRLALEAAAALSPVLRDGTFLVDLAPLSRPELLLDTVARILGAEIPPNRPLLDALADFLCEHNSLLVLDNCEHLLDECARVAGELLGACAELRVLATRSCLKSHC